MQKESEGGLPVSELIVHEGAVVRFDGVILQVRRLAVDEVEVCVVRSSGSEVRRLSTNGEVTFSHTWRLVSTMPVVRHPAGERGRDAVAHFSLLTKRGA